MEVLTAVIMSSMINTVFTQDGVGRYDVGVGRYDDGVGRYDVSIHTQAVDGSTMHFGKANVLQHCQKYCNASTLIYISNCSFPIPRCTECFCDSSCNSYGDCCPDSEGNLPTSKPPSLTCVQISVDDYKTGYLMEKSCPFTAHQTHIEEDVDLTRGSLQPVTSRSTGVVYFNEWYALCNGDVPFTAWKRKTVCTDQRVMTDVIENITNTISHTNNEKNNELEKNNEKNNELEKNSLVCLDVFIPTSEIRGRLRTCDLTSTYNSSNIVSRCNSTGLWLDYDVGIERLCATTHFPVVTHDTWFRSIYCYVCNGYKPNRTSCSNQSSSVWYDVINSNLLDAAELHDPVYITKTRWLDPITNTYRLLNCPPGSYVEKDVCVKYDSNTTEIEYWFEIAFALPTTNEGKQYTYACLENMVFDSLSRLFSTNESKLFSLQMETYITNTTNLEKLGVIVGFLPLVDENRTVFEETMTNSIYQNWYLNMNHTIFSLKPEFYNKTDKIYSTNKLSYILDAITDRCCRVSENETVMADSINTNKGLRSVYLARVPKCLYVRLNHTEFTIHEDVALLSYAEVFLKNSMYSLEQTELLVCLDDLLFKYTSLTARRHRADILDIVAVVCNALSMLCLALTFITYCRFPQLRTLPAKNNMFLVMSLFFSQGFSHSSALFNFEATVCSIAGLLVHFFWLTALLWMNVSSFHMMYVFVISKTSINQNAQDGLQRRYIVYVYITAIILIISNVLVSIVLGNGIGYGGDLCHLPSEFYSALTTYVIPLIIVFIANVAFFVRTICSISNVKQVTHHSGTNRQNVFVYLKLSALTGIVWLVIIFLGLAIAESYFEFILGSCQGFFIFFSFMVKRSIFNMWRSLCRSPVNRTSTSQTATQETTEKMLR